MGASSPPSRVPVAARNAAGDCRDRLPPCLLDRAGPGARGPGPDRLFSGNSCFCGNRSAAVRGARSPQAGGPRQLGLPPSCPQLHNTDRQVRSMCCLCCGPAGPVRGAGRTGNGRKATPSGGTSGRGAPRGLTSSPATPGGTVPTVRPPSWRQCPPHHRPDTVAAPPVAWWSLLCRSLPGSSGRRRRLSSEPRRERGTG